MGEIDEHTEPSLQEGRIHPSIVLASTIDKKYANSMVVGPEEVEIPESIHIVRIKKHVKNLKVDFEDIFPLVEQLSYDLFESGQMDNYRDAMEWTIELETRLNIHYLEIKLENENQW